MVVTSIITMLSCPGLHVRAQQAQAVIQTMCASQTRLPTARILHPCVGFQLLPETSGFFPSELGVRASHLPVTSLPGARPPRVTPRPPTPV